jgi:phospholipid/cholesterol/gamma-HCH transport system permease protein
MRAVEAVKTSALDLTPTPSPQHGNHFTLLFPAIGRGTIHLVGNLGAMAIFFFLAFAKILRRKQFPEIVKQVFYIGARSSLIVMLVGLFTGMVIGLQLFYTLVKFGSVGALGSAISLSLIRELGPVLTAIMITARAGSAMTAEIGILRISEQIDALYSMRIDPVRYLVSPRIAASIISFPLLTSFFDLIGIIGGYLTGVLLLGTNAGTYFYRVQSSINMVDVRGGFIKSLVFALIVSCVCCFQGYFCHMRSDGYGARAVGLATISAVVLSCVLILITDYIVTSFLM